MEHRFPEVWQRLKREDRYMQEHEQMARNTVSNINLLMPLCHAGKIFIFFRDAKWRMCGWNNIVTKFALKYFGKEKAEQKWGRGARRGGGTVAPPPPATGAAAAMAESK